MRGVFEASLLLLCLALLPLPPPIAGHVARSRGLCARLRGSGLALPEQCSDEVVIVVPDCADQDVAALAAAHGYRLAGGVGSLPCHFLLRAPPGLASALRRRRRHRRGATGSLAEDARIAWLSAQASLRRVKRDGSADSSEAPQPPQLPFRDPLYQYQWYLLGGGEGGFDMGVREAWATGLSGKGVTVTILDDGVEKDHPDLAENYSPAASFDLNSNDSDPTPRNDGQNKHGTRCAGEVAAVAGNEWCGVGIAYRAGIGGIRLLDGRVTDVVEGASLSHAPQAVDIYSASWGPDDDGRTLDGPGPLARQALHSGAVSGRDGLGSVFVWASGNGGSRFDSCSYDGYTTSIYTLAISSASAQNRAPWYLEKCPATIATTYSSGTFSDPAVVSTDVPSSCTRSQTGTSASAPMAAAIVALALEVNPSLSWRDIQHLVLRTANPKPLLANPGWNTNALGRQVSNTFGYGLMNASALTVAARSWSGVPEQHLCTYTADVSHLNPLELHSAASHTLTLTVSGCEDSEFPVRYLEHVQVGLKVSLSRRGALKAVLVSPQGTRVLLLPGRSSDSRHRLADFTIWPILSVHTWGEDPRGNWTLLLDVSDPTTRTNQGTLYHWSLMLYGTAEPAQPGDGVHGERGAMGATASTGASSAPNRPEAVKRVTSSRRFPFRPYARPSAGASFQSSLALAFLPVIASLLPAASASRL